MRNSVYSGSIGEEYDIKNLKCNATGASLCQVRSRFHSTAQHVFCQSLMLLAGHQNYWTAFIKTCRRHGPINPRHVHTSQQLLIASIGSEARCSAMLKQRLPPRGATLYRRDLNRQNYSGLSQPVQYRRAARTQELSGERVDVALIRCFFQGLAAVTPQCFQLQGDPLDVQPQGGSRRCGSAEVTLRSIRSDIQGCTALSERIYSRGLPRRFLALNYSRGRSSYCARCQ